jgi:hypothetical protein
MNANGRRAAALDAWRINLAQAWEVLFWIQQLDCSEDELRDAVSRVGPLAGEVRAELESRRP